MFHVSWVMILGFVVYVIFALFCVLNIITGVFVENSHSICSQDEERMVMDHVDSRLQWYADVKELFDWEDEDHTGKLTWPVFERHFNDVRVQAHFTKLGLELDAYNALGLFSIFDYDNDGYIDLEEFFQGVQRLHGNARSLDIYKLRHDNKTIQAALSALSVQLGSLAAFALHANLDEHRTPPATAEATSGLTSVTGGSVPARWEQHEAQSVAVVPHGASVCTSFRHGSHNVETHKTHDEPPPSTPCQTRALSRCPAKPSRCFGIVPC